jgi:hypothetical protein|tara:strand:- start:2189 stop:2641 length:453 start_codon:yes stop_codon:yes gene_type:complete
MSKVARAARVGSRQRPEIITGAKTITESETGELYLINYNAAATIAITLPAVREGAYFRFQFMAQMADNAAQIDITAAGSDVIKGTITNILYAGSSADTTIATNKDDGTDTKITLIDDIHVGSYVDVYCDGTSWQASGMVVGGALNVAVFA